MSISTFPWTAARSVPPVALAAPPWQLSGVVHGVLNNDGRWLARLGAAALEPPYRGAPRTPVLYLKPHNTLASSGARIPVPARPGWFELWPTIGLVFGSPLARATPDAVNRAIAGWLLVADLSLPQESYYRPNISQKARDQSCVLAPEVAPVGRFSGAGLVAFEVEVDGVSTPLDLELERPAAELAAEVSRFLSFGAGDILLLGLPPQPVAVRAGQRFTVRGGDMGALDAEVIAEAMPQAETGASAR